MEAWKRSRLVDQVTVGEEKTTAGVWQLDELVQYVQSSGGSSSRGDVAALILKRLHANESPIVKAKCLRCVRYLCMKDPMSRHAFSGEKASVIRGYVQWGGKQDALRGDALNKAVREAAADALKAVFDDDGGTERSGAGEHGGGMTTTATRGKIEGFGSGGPVQSSNGGGGGGGGGGGSGWSGYGGAVRGALGRIATSSGFAPYPAHQQQQSSLSSFQQQQQQQQRGGGYASPAIVGRDSYPGDDEIYASSNLASSQQQPPGQTASGLSLARPSAVQQLSSSTQSVGTAEEELVARMCQSGGVGRAQPSPKETAQFVSSVSAMDGAAAAAALLAKMRGAAWQPAFRALCYLEACVKNGDAGSSCADVAAAFQNGEGMQAVERLAASPQASVRDRARRMLELSNGGKSDAAPSAAQPTQDLIGDMHTALGDMMAPAAAPTPTPAAAAAASPSLFAGMTIGGNDAPAPAPPPVDPFAIAQAAPVVAAPSSPAPIANTGGVSVGMGMGGLMDMGMGAPVPAAPPAPSLMSEFGDGSGGLAGMSAAPAPMMAPMNGAMGGAGAGVPANNTGMGVGMGMNMMQPPNLMGDSFAPPRPPPAVHANVGLQSSLSMNSSSSLLSPRDKYDSKKKSGLAIGNDPTAFDFINDQMNQMKR